MNASGLQPGVDGVRPEDADRLVEVWEASVRATHHFLSEADILCFRPLVWNDVVLLEHLYCVRDTAGTLVGFAGVAAGKIEALFVHPAWHQLGIGRRLVQHAVAVLGASTVDVNEQNPSAVAFYEHAGFSIVGRSEMDGMGKPFPLLHMRREDGTSNAASALTTPSISRALIADVDTIVRILIASKEASFPDTTDDHDRDVAFWTRRWRGYIAEGSRAQQSKGDGWVFIAERSGEAVGYVAYHHTTRHGTDAELQNIYVLKEAQGQGVGIHLLGVVAHRLRADGSRTMCVGYDETSPYTRFYFKHGAVEIAPGAPWAVWHDVPALAERLPPPPDALLDA